MYVLPIDSLMITITRMLQEASVLESPSELRHLFVIILTTFALTDPKRHWEGGPQNILNRERNQHAEVDIQFSDEIFYRVLIHIAFQTNTKTFWVFPHLIELMHPVNTEWMRKINYQPYDQAAIVHNGITHLNND